MRSFHLSFYCFAVLVSTVITLALPKICISAPYVKLKITPENVGIVYQVGFQQFNAYGITASGETHILTDHVDWYLEENPLSIQTMPPEEVAEIDKNGLLTVKSSWGRFKVTACYPRGCGPNSQILVPLNYLLLKQTRRP